MTTQFNVGNPYADLQNISEKRSVLCKLTAKAREQQELLAVQLGDGDIVIPRVNDILLKMYRSETHKVFKTYQEWKKDGKQVKKGAKAFCIWSKPRKIEKEKEGKKRVIKERFFAVAFMFSDAQVK